MLEEQSVYGGEEVRELQGEHCTLALQNTGSLSLGSEAPASGFYRTVLTV